MHRRPRTLVIAALVLAGLLTSAAGAEAADDYSNPAYLQHDLDNVARSLAGRQAANALSLRYATALAPTAAEAFQADLRRQVEDLPQGRLYATAGQIPGAGVGDPLAYRSQTPTTVSFLTRTGAKLVGRLWSDGRSGPHPGVVITPGSLQGMQNFYWWAARSLSAAGYLVLTFDAQGQGESETFGHAAGDPVPTGAGVPFQQEANFVDGTVDALRFLLSTPSAPYVPGTWTADQVARARGAGDASLSWANPQAPRLDATRVALAGHSLGARAISVVQQCSDQAQLWRRLAVCGGRSFPIRAVVAWDRLSADVTPVVPAMDQQADGYFITPQPTTQAPDPGSHLAGLRRWRAAGIDAYALTVRGGTHDEWVDVPYVLPATTYGRALAERYTRAWIDRYLSPRSGRRELASATLAESPRIDRRTDGRDQLPWTASFLSARYLGGFSFHDARGGIRRTGDLRAYGGASPVGDWAGANADRPRVRATG